MILFTNKSLAAILYSAKSEIDAIVDIYSLAATVTADTNQNNIQTI